MRGILITVLNGLLDSRVGALQVLFHGGAVLHVQQHGVRTALSGGVGGTGSRAYHIVAVRQVVDSSGIGVAVRSSNCLVLQRGTKVLLRLDPIGSLLGEVNDVSVLQTGNVIVSLLRNVLRSCAFNLHNMQEESSQLLISA